MYSTIAKIFLILILVSGGSTIASDQPLESWEVVEQSAKDGNAFAQWAVGNRRLVDGDYTQALTWFKKSADQEYVPAESSLVMMYGNGMGTERNYAEATKWLNKTLLNRGKKSASNPSVPDLMAALKSQAKSDGTRLAKLKTDAENGSAFAQAMLGLFYQEGLLVARDSKESIRWLKKAAAQDFVFAQGALGTAYADGNGVERNRDEALQWYRKAVQQGEPSACFLLGNLLFDAGDGNPKDFPEAFKAYRTAAEAGMTHAQGMLGLMYEMGAGVEKDSAEAFKWTLKSAEGGLNVAQYYAADAYEAGTLVKQDLKKAFELYRKSAEQDYVPAQAKLGFMYVNGLGIEKNTEESIRWFKMAADRGEPYARAYLGFLYVRGEGVTMDVIKGLRLLVAAAEKNNEKGTEFLSYLADNGFRNDEAEQYQKFEKEVENGSAEDQWLICRLLMARTTSSPEQDAVTARWLSKAAAQGHVQAQAECKRRKIEFKGEKK